LKTPFTPENARPAVYAFDGDVYTGLDAYSIPIEKLEIYKIVYAYFRVYMGVETVGFNPGVPIRNGDEVAIENIKIYMILEKKVTNVNKELEKGSFVNLASMNIFRRWLNLQILRIIKSLNN
jgi:cytoplasmic iron level regulating protein YaaA (DUF328/UPF0246 family)